MPRHNALKRGGGGWRIRHTLRSDCAAVDQRRPCAQIDRCVVRLSGIDSKTAGGLDGAFLVSPHCWGLVTSPVMPGQEVAIGHPLPATVLQKLPLENRTKEIYTSLKICGGPKSAASVNLSVRPRSFAMNEADSPVDLFLMDHMNARHSVSSSKCNHSEN